MTNAVVMEINFLAGQLFELFMMVSELCNQKSKRVFRILADEYQTRIEGIYGEHILRNVILTKDYSFPSEDNTGQFNEHIAKKTRETIAMHHELEGKPVYPTEEIKVETDATKKKGKKRSMQAYAPLIFEECYIKHSGVGKTKLLSKFEYENEPELNAKIDPTGGINPGIF
jgi:hypothetical protein